MYTSGRTVKTSRKARPTTVASATRDARRLIDTYLPGVATITVDSNLTADPHSLAPQVRTVITYPATVDASDIACAVESLTGYIASTWNTVSITILRTAA
jgi:hypothetical protein